MDPVQSLGPETVDDEVDRPADPTASIVGCSLGGCATRSAPEEFELVLALPSIGTIVDA